MNWPPNLELPSAGKHGKGSGETIRYKVEARTTYYEPAQIGGMLVDNIWREVPMSVAPSGIGVPCRRAYDGSDGHGTYEYEAAQALRWWFHALASVDWGRGLCIDTRLVAVRYKYTYEIEEIGVCKVVGGDDRRRPFDPALPRAASGMPLSENNEDCSRPKAGSPTRSEAEGDAPNA